MAGSIVVKVRRAVIAGLKAEQALIDAKADVTYAYNWSDAQKRKSVFTNRARATHAPAALKAGRNFRREEMDFDVVVLVKGVNVSAEDNADQAQLIGDVIEEYFADRKGNQLNIPGLVDLTLTGMETNDLGAKNGAVTEITYTVRYHARLT